MKRFFIIAMAIGFQFVLISCTGTLVSNSSTEASLPTLDADQIALGEQIYSVNCASCHGVNLEGEADWKTQNEDDSFKAPPHSADGHTWHHPDSLLLEAITLGWRDLKGSI